MRLGVLDIGSNTGHLLVVDAHGGAAPLPAYSYKEPLRLAEHLDADGAMSDKGVEALARFVGDALRRGGGQGLRGDPRLRHLGGPRRHQQRRGPRPRRAARPGSSIEVLPGEDEARLTFLAVRRWFGWSSGRLAVFDIGGGSLEIAVGSDEAPDVATSLPLGAGRLTRELADQRRRRRGGARAPAPDPLGDRARRRLGAARRPSGPRRRHLQDVPLAGPHLRRRPVDRGPRGCAGCCRPPTWPGRSPR